jgi:hypothetical protein
MNQRTPLDILQQPENLRRGVSSVAKCNEEQDETTRALLNYVSSWRRTWTLREWVDELKKLDSCKLTVESWLQTHWLD